MTFNPQQMKIRITQLKSQIDRPKDQKATLQALGLGRIKKTAIHEVNPMILGMAKKVSHLVLIEEVEE